jgi:hypothetical protein
MDYLTVGHSAVLLAIHLVSIMDGWMAGSLVE